MPSKNVSKLNSGRAGHEASRDPTLRILLILAKAVAQRLRRSGSRLIERGEHKSGSERDGPAVD